MGEQQGPKCSLLYSFVGIRYLFLTYVTVLVPLLILKANYSLWLDEAYSVFVARKPFGELVNALWLETWPPLYYIVLSFWIKLFGDNEQSVRSLSVVVFLLCLFATYRLAMNVFPDRRVALYTAWLFGVTQLAVSHATNARGYMMLCLVSAIATNEFFAMVYRDERRNSVVLFYVVACYAGLMTHYSFVYVVFMHLFLSAIKSRKRLMRLLLSYGLAACVFGLTWGAVFLHQLLYIAPLALTWIKPTFTMTVINGLLAPFGSLSGNVRNTVATFVSWSVLLLPLAISGWRKRPNVDTRMKDMLIMTAVGFAALLIVSRFKPSYAPGRQDVIFLPLICLILAKGLCTFASARATLMVLLSLSLLRIGIATYLITRSDAGTDRWVARMICSLAQRNDAVVLTDLSWCGVNYYLEKICHSKDLEIIAFPSDIPSHPGWRNLRQIAEPDRLEEEITILTERIDSARRKGSANVIVGINPAPVYQVIPRRLSNHLTFVGRWDVLNYDKTGTFVSEILQYSLRPPPPRPSPSGKARGDSPTRADPPSR